jgi:hypothetical protein
MAADTTIAVSAAGAENVLDGLIAVMLAVPSATPCSQKLPELAPAGITTLIEAEPATVPLFDKVILVVSLLVT